MTHSLSSTVRSFCLLALLTASQAILANDYPTLERVDHVLTCMRLAGGQSVDNLYACSCKIDVIAQQVDFDARNPTDPPLDGAWRSHRSDLCSPAPAQRQSNVHAPRARERDAARPPPSGGSRNRPRSL